MKEEVLAELYKPFDLKSRRGVGGKTFDYVTSDDVIDRLNKVFRGNWSSEVADFREIEDQVLIRVRVIVDHPDQLGKFLVQEGYASQLVARYTSGDQKGKIIDVGNVYKSAYSKAIKVAVEKWGIGLHLSRETKDDESIFPDIGTTPTGTSSPNSNACTPVVVANDSVPYLPPLSATVLPFPKTGGVDSFVPPDFVSIPAVPKEVPAKSNNVVVTSSAPKDVPDFGLKPSPNKEITYVTPIQQTAIEHIMQWSNLTFKELLDKSLKRITDLPESLDKIRYEDGIKIIQYGNTTRGLK